ncbi:multidrug resistance protein [Vigna unguiculata]|uniref:Protein DETOXIFICATION n=1 Tax=Vigna unguiculata TaxID=3917 RepID=A0A4D6MUV6_VIGUN|nr:multidrug resistance protein [Vigna unguiculata]
MFFSGIRNALADDELGLEILHISLPTTLALAADPIASLIDTAFIGHIGPVELAAVGVSIAIFNQISKITIIPLVSVTTSLVAEEDAAEQRHQSEKEILLEESVVNESVKVDIEGQEDKPGNTFSRNVDKRDALGRGKAYIPSASSGIVIGGVLGVLQTLFLIFTAKPMLNYMGVDSNSPMFKPAQQYLTLRSFGAPAVIISMAIQGVFRGIRDTKTPLYATVMGDATNIILDPLLMFVVRLGVSGAAIAHIFSQYLISILLLWSLMKQVVLLPPTMKDFQFGKILKNGFLLLVKVGAATFCVTLSASLAARKGSTTMAAFQICLQIWMATSLLADGLAVAGQAIIASEFAKRDYKKVIESASRVLQLGLILGLVLSVLLISLLPFGSKLFTNDRSVLQLISIGIPYVAATQPINALAFVFDGINYGASDFTYSAYSMIMVAVVSICSLYVLSSSFGFTGIWIALSIYMALRIFAGFWRPLFSSNKKKLNNRRLVLHQDLGASLLKTLICASSSMRLLTIVSFGILILTCTAQATLKRYPIMEYHYFSYFFLF